MQFALVCRETEHLKDLLDYAFEDIYHKISWVERIQALDLASKMGHEKVKEMLEILQLSFLRADYEDIF